MIGPISPLPNYVRIAKSITSKSPKLVLLEFVPIRLGKRHSTYFTRPRNFRPYFWEYMNENKRAYLPDQDGTSENDVSTVQDLSSGIIRSDLNHFGKLGSAWFNQNEGSREMTSLLSEIPFGQKFPHFL